MNLDVVAATLMDVHVMSDKGPGLYRSQSALDLTDVCREQERGDRRGTERTIAQVAGARRRPARTRYTIRALL